MTSACTVGKFTGWFAAACSTRDSAARVWKRLSKCVRPCATSTRRNASRRNLLTERRRNICSGRRRELEGRRINRSARFVGVSGDDAIAIWLQHFRAFDLQRFVKMNDETLEQSLHRRRSRHKIEYVNIAFML